MESSSKGSPQVNIQYPPKIHPGDVRTPTVRQGPAVEPKTPLLDTAFYVLTCTAGLCLLGLFIFSAVSTLVIVVREFPWQ